MANYKLIISYNGTTYQGWQRSSLGMSIEEILEQSLQPILKKKVILQAASRTDSGVHAEAQVVNFVLEDPLPNLNKFLHSLNGILPQDIRALNITEQPPSFHPTLDTIAKRYTYWICNHPIQYPFYRSLSWHFPPLLDLKKMEQAAELLIGTHDFSSFCNSRPLWTRTPICTLEAITFKIADSPLICTPPEYRHIHISITGNRFLYKMMRNLVGTLTYVGCGKIPLEQTPFILEGKDRVQAGMTAPAHGLRLSEVLYPKIP